MSITIITYIVTCRTYTITTDIMYSLLNIHFYHNNTYYIIFVIHFQISLK